MFVRSCYSYSDEKMSDKTPSDPKNEPHERKFEKIATKKLRVDRTSDQSTVRRIPKLSTKGQIGNRLLHTNERKNAIFHMNTKFGNS